MKQNTIVWGTTTTMFVPPTPDRKLLEMLKEAKEELQEDISWRMKLLEKPGVPMKNLFSPKFPILQGCVLGEKCGACKNNGLTCALNVNRRSLVKMITYM